ncbi:hypothetical protein BDV28DRAFT_128628, partial [Aspergillus coremiiformis]
MRPRPGTLPRGARLRVPVASPIRQTGCGVRNYTRTAETLRKTALQPGVSRPVLRSAVDGAGVEQTRSVTHKYLQRVKDAELEWAGFAEEIKAGKRKSFVQHLEERCLLHDVVGERDLLHRIFTEKRVGLYAGVDPTAPSLHVGHMLPFMVLAWGYAWDLPVTFVLGGATSRVGDPTGRLKGRDTVDTSVRKANMASMHMQLRKLGASIEHYTKRFGFEKTWTKRRALVNNNTWWNGVPFMDVVKDIGVHMRLGPMLGRDTVKSRLANDGMSFAEFVYPLLQAWDWWVLFRKGVQVQVGGADQYGNILFGKDAVKSISRNTIHEQDRNPLEKDIDHPIGLTTPLLTSANGEKFGKSAGNAIWLDKDMTSTFELYQFFVRTPDDVVERYLKMFTFLPLPEIAKVMEEQNQDPSKRFAQHTLACEFVEIVHGRQEAYAVTLQHRHLFRSRWSTAEPTPLQKNSSPPANNDTSPTSGDINPQSGNKYAPQTNFSNMPPVQVILPESLVYNQHLHKVLWSAGMVASKSEGHRIVVNQGAYVGSRPGDSGPMSDELTFTPIKTWGSHRTKEFVHGQYLFLKLGKWKFRTVKIVTDEEFKQLGLNPPGWDVILNAPTYDRD